MTRFNLSTIRKGLNLTIKDAAEHCGISIEEMMEYENYPGDIPARVVFKLRTLYGIPLDYIKV